MLTPGCMSPERRYRVLSVFFDGVPVPGAVQTAGTVPLEDLPSGGRIGRLPTPTAPILSAHGPYAQKECEQCHDGRYSNRLVAEEDELCWQCHEHQDFPGEIVHGPMAGGLCIGCHDPHRSPNDFLLVRRGPELCGECHDPATFELAERHHPEEDDDCLRCHDPHATDRQYMLRPEQEVRPQARVPPEAGPS
jgi:predicted CXXCH cytochrome family protein